METPIAKGKILNLKNMQLIRTKKKKKKKIKNEKNKTKPKKKKKKKELRIMNYRKLDKF